MRQYATVEDIKNLWRTLTPTEEERANELLPIVSARLRTEAKNVGKDLKAYNQVCLRAETYIGWGILDAAAFARITDEA